MFIKPSLISKVALLLLAGCFSSSAWAGTLSEVLKLSEPPNGVVIEFVRGSETAWEKDLTALNQSIDRLHAQFPELQIAVVSHGGEQFALTRDNQTRFPALHSGIKGLTENGIDVHVCGTHASWRDITPEDFPEYVDVSPSGPAQINVYRDLGYLLIDDLDL